MADPFDVIVTLTSARRVGASWRARCPAHPDDTPSLAVRRGDSVPVVIHCHAGCEPRDILRALNLPDDFLTREDADVAPPARQNGHDRAGSVRIITATTRYPLRDAAGNLVAVHVRRDLADGSKQMPWLWPDGSPSSPDRTISPTTLPLYGSELLGDVDERVPIVVTEGEKAAAAVVTALKLPALGTVTGAASTPGPAALEALRDRKVVLWPDNDPIGRDHMARVSRALAGVARATWTLDVPGLPDHGDAADFVGQGRGRAELVALIRDATRPSVKTPEGSLQTPGVDGDTPDAPVRRRDALPATTAGGSSDGWPVLAPDALYGVAGEIVERVAPHTEAHPAGILASLLTICGVVAGRERVLFQGGVHAANVYTLLVGESGVGRKGTAVGIAERVVDQAVPGWRALAVYGIGSGEGLVMSLQRRIDVAAKTLTPPEYRVLLPESEFSRLLTVMAREGSSLGMVLRDAWDGVPVGRHLAGSVHQIPRHHVGVLGQITPVDLQARLTTTDAANGFGNRFMWALVRASRIDLVGADPLRYVDTALTTRLGEALVEARSSTATLELDDDARDLWDTTYASARALRRRDLGMRAALMSRDEVHVLRMALIYALLDGETKFIHEAHLRAAIAVVTYSRATVERLWRESVGDPDADALLEELKVVERLPWMDLRDLGLRGAAAEAAVARLVAAGRVRVTREATGRRPRRVVELTGQSSDASSRPSERDDASG